MLKKLFIPAWFSPAVTVFFASLLLSMMAHVGKFLNRDGMFYVRTSEAFITGGFDAAKELFNWPFFPILMAIVSQGSGLEPEQAGHLLNAFFLAGACAFLIAIVQRTQPHLAWMVCLTVLSIPGLNEYRHELLREYGCWFFVMLAFWLAYRWSDKPNWMMAIGVQSAILFATLFRPEAFTLFAALFFWQFLEAPRTERWRRLLQIGWLPVLSGLFLLTLYLSGLLPGGSRLATELGRVNLERFDAKAQILASALIGYAHDEAYPILFFGSLSIVPLKILNKLGFFVIPLIFLVFSRRLYAVILGHPLLGWGIAVHLFVLSVFVIDLQFLAGRYVGPVLLFSVPFIAAGLAQMIKIYPRWRSAIFLVIFSLMLANVVSLGPGKRHYAEAGDWLRENVTKPSNVYIESGRVAYYAGWKNQELISKDKRSALMVTIDGGQYDFFVFEISRKEPPADGWLSRIPLKVVKKFEYHNGDAVVIAVPEKTD